jgi:MFS family permease
MAQGRYVVIGAFVPLATYALFHIVTIFPLSWINLFTARPVGEFLLLQCAGAVVGVAGVALSGLIADKIGRRPLLAICAGLIAAFSFTPLLLDSRHGQTLFIILGFGLLGLSFGQAAGAVTSNFTSRYRYTGAALTSDLAWLTGAAFAPLVALGVATRFGLFWVSAYLLSGVICTWAALLFNKLEMREMAPDDVTSPRDAISSPGQYWAPRPR